MLNKLTLCLVLNSSSGSFLAELKQVIDQLQTTVIFDYVGGELPTQIFEAMPVTTEYVGNLTQTPIAVNTAHIMFTQKTIRGLVEFLQLLCMSHEERQAQFKRIAKV